MSWFRYLSHPEVDVQPDVAVPDWSLRSLGRERVEALIAREPTWLTAAQRLLTSPERKARETAELLGQAIGIEATVIETSAEVDRSATGFVPHERHEELADQLFAHPNQSADGWERAVDASQRICAAMEPYRDLPGGTIAVGHGGVGTLLWCAWQDLPIRRSFDQSGQGQGWLIGWTAPADSHPWRRFEEL